MQSSIYKGKVRHRRFFPKNHEFTYPLYMMGINVDDVLSNKLTSVSRLFAFNKFSWLSFNSNDYLRQKQSDDMDLKQTVWKTVAEMKTIDFDETEQGEILFLGQCRCLGLYFSPINLFYCYDNNVACRFILAEVSNTPWNQKHYYLLENINDKSITHEKNFHVSPFMRMDVDYKWVIKPPSENLSVHIESISKNIEHSHLADNKLFDATMNLKRMDFTANNIRATLLRQPMMTLLIVIHIYWQALRLFLKKVPFVPYPKNN